MALASLVRTHGSTYRKPGARMLITASGETIGVLSGGCLEDLIARDGLEVIRKGTATLRLIDTKQYFGCEGKLEIFVERIPSAGRSGNVLTQLADQIASRTSACISTRFKGEDQGTRLERSLTLLAQEDEVFCQHIPLPVQLFAFGQGPEIEPMHELASLLGWSLKVFGHPCEFTEEHKGDHLTAALIMNHHFGKDVESLLKVLPLRLPYVAVLGPRRRTNQLLGQLVDRADLLPEAYESIHSPAGLDIGSETPEEIVLSITSEVLAVLSGHQAGFLCHRDDSSRSIIQFTA